MTDPLSKFIAGSKAIMMQAVVTWLEEKVVAQPDVTVEQLLTQARQEREELNAKAYAVDRLAAVACGVKGAANCRHDWNAKHPDDPVTEGEQRAWEAKVVARMARR